MAQRRRKGRPPFLPTEIVAMILGYLPDLNTLFFAVQTNRHIYMSYEEYARQITTAILRRECSEVKGYEMFSELDFAIRHNFIRSGHILDALMELGRPLFQRRRLKKLLFPFAERLARKLARDDLQADADALLQQARPRRRPLSLHERLLAELTDRVEDEEELIAVLTPIWQRRFGVALALSTPEEGASFGFRGERYALRRTKGCLFADRRQGNHHTTSGPPMRVGYSRG